MAEGGYSATPQWKHGPVGSAEGIVDKNITSAVAARQTKIAVSLVKQVFQKASCLKVKLLFSQPQANTGIYFLTSTPKAC